MLISKKPFLGELDVRDDPIDQLIKIFLRMKQTLDRQFKLNLYPYLSHNLFLEMREIFSKREISMFKIFLTLTYLQHIQLLIL